MTSECKCAATDMAPCYLRDGMSALSMEGCCVGCGKPKGELDDENPKEQEPESRIENPESSPSRSLKAEKLLALLGMYPPELREKLLEALETGRFFLTISFQKKDRPEDPHDLQHFWHQTGFNKNDVLPSLRHFANDYNAKENPTAVEGDGEGWV